MQFPIQQQDMRTPNHNDNMHTPRSVNSRASNRQPQELSPFVGGKRNNDYVNPTYESKLFQGQNQPIQNNNGPQNNYYEFNQPKPRNINQNPTKTPPRTPQKGGPKSIVSNSSSSSQAIDMVCTNCINKHLMMQKQERDRIEKEKDQLLRQISESNYKNALQKEQEKQRMMKEQYKNDANIQLEQINNKKAKEESVKKSQRNDPNSLPINNGDYDRYQRIQELQKELREDLLKQINNKEIEKRSEKQNPTNYKTTLDIGEYRPRTVNTKMYGDELRDQILWKENQKQWEKENDKKLADAQKDVDKRFNEDVQGRKYQLESERKEDLKRAYQDYIQNKMRKMQEEQQEKERFNDSQQRLKEEMERQQYEDYLKRKDLEKTVGDTVKNQMEYNNLKKKMEKAEASSPMMSNVCVHKNKMVSCSECNKRFPKQQMCKRAESPLKFTPKKYID